MATGRVFPDLAVLGIDGDGVEAPLVGDVDGTFVVEVLRDDDEELWIHKRSPKVWDKLLRVHNCLSALEDELLQNYKRFTSAKVKRLCIHNQAPAVVDEELCVHIDRYEPRYEQLRWINGLSVVLNGEMLIKWGIFGEVVNILGWISAG